MNKIAIITGGSGSLGLELIQQYLDKEYIVYAIYNSKEIPIENHHLLKYSYDLEKETDFNEIVQDVQKNIDSDSLVAIVSAAGIYGKSNIEDFQYEECYKYMNINSFSFLSLYSKLFPIIKNSSLCNVVLISTNLLKRLNKGSIYYGLSKSLNNQIIKHIAYEHGEFHILANAIAPGMFISNMNKDMEPQKIENITQNIPIKKMLKACDLASYIVNFTEQNQYITGEIITIDGGNTLGY